MGGPVKHTSIKHLDVVDPPKNVLVTEQNPQIVVEEF